MNRASSTKGALLCWPCIGTLLDALRNGEGGYRSILVCNIGHRWRGRRCVWLPCWCRRRARHVVARGHAARQRARKVVALHVPSVCALAVLMQTLERVTDRSKGFLNNLHVT